MTDNRIHEILKNLMNGRIIITNDDTILINKYSSEFLKTGENIETIKEILIISNILYNNTDRSILPLEDGVYDLVVVKYNQMTNGMAPVGAPTVHLDNSGSGDSVETADSLVEPIVFLDDKPYLKNIICTNTKPIPEDTLYDTSSTKELSRNVRDIPAKYPELVGTLHKCKFVSIYEAANMRVDLNDSSVAIFDRDFFNPTFPMVSQYAMQKHIDPEGIIELKYDGMSVEAEVENDTIISANTRGDTANNIATDLTDIFGGMKFPRAKGLFKQPVRFGLKFEAIITYYDLEILEKEHGIKYKNPRVAVSGLLNSKYAARYRDFITLVPIKSSGLQFNSVEDEINFLNAYYSSGVTMQYAMLRGDYNSIMTGITEFTNTAESVRPFMNYAYDGVVFSYTDPDVKRILGRKNSIDLWSMAIKFNASVKNTYFEGYTYTVGQDGRITPMAHFTPVEFFGSIHDRTTIHSYNRFNTMQLRKGDIVSVKYVNDVICYLTKPFIPYNVAVDKITAPEEFPETCPFCGSEISISESGDSAYCTNMNCPERIVSKVTNMMKKLKLKDIGESSVRKLELTGLTDFLNLGEEEIAKALNSKILARHIMEQIESIKDGTWNDYELLGAIGFDNVSASRWELIMGYITIDNLIHYSDDELYTSISRIKGIGDVIANTVTQERKYLMKDIMTIASLDVNHKSTCGISCPEVRFSGFRNEDLVNKFNSCGYSADSNKGVTKNTSILVIPYYGFTSTKVVKAMKSKTTKIISANDAWTLLNSIK